MLPNIFYPSSLCLLHYPVRVLVGMKLERCQLRWRSAHLTVRAGKSSTS